MSSTEDDDCIIKLDTNIEVETFVRNRFEELDESHSTDPLSNHASVSSDEEELVESSEESLASTLEMSELRKLISDGSENDASAVSDISAESTDSMGDKAEIKKQKTASKVKSILFESRLKYVNCKELIVFCIDMSSDMEKVPFVMTDEVKHSTLSMVKRAIGMFVHNKHFIDEKHEFSLMVLYDSATWVCEFTNNPGQLVDALNDLGETHDCNSCDLSSVISLISEKYPFILSPDYHPPHIHRILRIILIYGRSNCMIGFSGSGTKDLVLNFPSLFLDIIYLHELPSEKNKCVEIYEKLCSLDYKKKSYIFETTRSVTNLHNAMGRLLSHPFQRAAQKNAKYKLQGIAEH